MSEIFRKCSSCKKDMFVGQKYFVCSVSTCQGRKTNYAFCSVDCWDSHLPIERHRGDSAGAVERIATAAAAMEAAAIGTSAAASPKTGSTNKGDDEVLVVVTKVRKYIADRSGLNTSAEVYDTLTAKIKALCDRAVESAKANGRKTVMSRDFT